MKPEEKLGSEQQEWEREQELARYRQQQHERARVARFMGCSIDKVVRGRDGGWTTR
jgi:hypothetical protein